MSDNDNENDDSTKVTTEEVDNTDEVDETDDQSGSEDLGALQEKNKRLFERAKKAEAEAKILKAERLKKEEQAKAKVETKDTEPSKKQDGLSSMDAIVLMGAKVTEKEDIELVADYAKFKGISIAEALKSSVVKSELAEKAEQRTTAEATNTSNARRGTTKLSDEQINANAEQGKEVDPDALAEARMNIRKAKK